MTDSSRSGSRVECFELDGALVRGNANMSPQARAAVSEVIAAAKAKFAAESCACGHRAHPDGKCPVRACGCRENRAAVDR